MNDRKLSPSISQDSRNVRNVSGGQASSPHNFNIAQLVRVIQSEHNYALPLIPVEKKSRCFPARFLFQDLAEFINVPEPKSKLENLLTRKSPTKKSLKSKTLEENDIDIDVTTVDEDPRVQYDGVKARHLMGECERHVIFARLAMHDVAEDWEDRILRTGWTKPQKKLFNRMLKILHADHLARLTYVGNSVEPIQRRLSIDKTARDVRCLLTDFCWDTKLTQWLHGVLVDNLSLDYLSAYLDILQTLKAKIPALIDRMILLSTTKGGVGNRGNSDESDQLNAEALNLLLKRQWDPFAPIRVNQFSQSIQSSKYKKLSVAPVFLIVPSGPGNTNIICHYRQKSLISLLSGLGKVISVTLSSQTANKLNVHVYSERMLTTSKKKLQEVMASCPEKPVYVVGWGSGAIVAATIAKTEKVAGVICLAFPCVGTFGSRADIDDPLYDMKAPTLFVIGDRATNASVTDMEIFRKKLKCENALSIICHADEFLRVLKYHQKQLLVTQSYVDKCIVDEIAWFIVNLPILQEELRIQSKAMEDRVSDGPQIPSNNSASKRKAYYRPQTSTNSSKDPNSSNSSNYVTASQLLQQNFNKRKLEESLSQPHPLGMRKPALGISPLARPFPSKLVKESDSLSSFVGPSKMTTLKTNMHLSTQKPKSPEKSKLKSGSNVPQVVRNETPKPPQSSMIRDTIPTIVSNQQKNAAALSMQRIGEEYASSQILKRAITGGTTTSSSTSLMSVPGFSSATSAPSSIPGLPSDTTAILSPHPIQMKASNSDILRRFAEQQQAIQDSENKQALHDLMKQQKQMTTPAPIPRDPQQQGSSSTNIDSATMTVRGPSQHLYRPLNQSHSQTGVVMNVTDRPLPTRCTDDSLSNFNDVNSNLGPHGPINRELFQTLKSTLSLSKDVKMYTTPTRYPSPIPTQFQVVRLTKPLTSDAGPTPSIQAQGQHGYISIPISTSATLTAPATPATTSTIAGTSQQAQQQASSYPSKYSVFASKDRRTMQKFTTNFQHNNEPVYAILTPIPTPTSTSLLKSSAIAGEEQGETTTTKPLPSFAVMLKSSSLSPSPQSPCPVSLISSIEMSKGNNGSPVVATASLQSSSLTETISKPLEEVEKNNSHVQSDSTKIEESGDKTE